MRNHLPDRAALAELGVTWAEFEAPLAAGAAGPAMLEALQKRARARFRELALELHPDRTGGDSEKTERYKRLAMAKDQLDALVVQPPQSPRPPQQWSATWSGATSTTTSWWSPPIIRVRF